MIGNMAAVLGFDCYHSFFTKVRIVAIRPPLKYRMNGASNLHNSFHFEICAKSTRFQWVCRDHKSSSILKPKQQSLDLDTGFKTYIPGNKYPRTSTSNEVLKVFDIGKSFSSIKYITELHHTNSSCFVNVLTVC